MRFYRGFVGSSFVKIVECAWTMLMVIFVSVFICLMVLIVKMILVSYYCI